jgi:diguanylate cyclase (GGDEF)-like protein/PAS domain S-box-containing protein
VSPKSYMSDTTRSLDNLISGSDASARTMIDPDKFLAEASKILASSLDYETTLTAVAKLVSPRMADWCAVDLLEEGALRRLAIAHIDPAKIKLAAELMDKYPTPLDAPHGTPKVIREGNLEFYPEVTDAMLQGAARDEEHLRIMRELCFKSILIVPLLADGKPFGAITFVNCETDQTFTAEHVQLASEIGRRAGRAIDNARMYAEARKLAEYDQKQWLLFSALFENAPIGFAYLNQNLEYIIVNKSLATMMGKTPQEFIGRHIGEVNPAISKVMEPSLQKVLSTGEPVLDKDVSIELAATPGRINHWLASCYPIFSEDQVIGVGVVANEITERKEIEESFRRQALFDTLTKLPNRAFFEEALRTSILTSEEKEQVLGVLFLDLDRFKNINDTLGHTVGDHILKEVSTRLRHSVRKDDLVSRLAGDEFMILLRDVKTAENAARVAKKLQKALAPSIKSDAYTLHAVASIGIAMYPENGRDVENLFRNADAALHSAKARGRNRFEFYDTKLNDRASEQINLEGAFRQALEKNELRVHYEPIVDIRTGKILSLEALVRWQHPQRGLLAPGQFISVAEETGLIVPMGRWVLRRICRDFKALQKSGKVMVPRIAVNLSAREFLEANLVRNIREILAETEMDPSNLELEITESIAMDDFFKTSDKLNELDQMGIRITIDDFGTGYSSLSYLKKFPIRKLKIDRSFVQDCTENMQDAALVKAIIAMAQSLHLMVVAEGVEKEEQLRYLASLGCDAVQGKLIALARDTRELNLWFKDRTSLFAQSYWKAMD